MTLHAVADIPVIAPKAAEFRAAGGVSFECDDGCTVQHATCGLCGRWEDGELDRLKQWAHDHAVDHDALRPSVLGVDPSLRRAGIAIVSRNPYHLGGGAWPTLITHRGEDGHENATYRERGARLVRQARAIMGVIDGARAGGADIRLAAIEGPAYGMTSGHAFDRGGLWWALYTSLASRGVPVAVVTPAHREKFVAGATLRHAHSTLSQAEAKQRIVDETRSRWSLPNGAHNATASLARINHDQADALALADMAALHLKLGVPWKPARRHVENVALVDWPEATP